MTIDAISSDPVAIEGREIEVLSRRFTELEEFEFKSCRSIHPSQRASADVWDRLQIHRDHLSILQANSIAGAAVQLRELALIVDASGTEGMTKSDRLRINRLYHSAMVAIRAHLSEDASEALGLNRESYCNSWTTPQQTAA